jgi:hypothetical protein
MNMIVPAANSKPKKRSNNLMPEGPLPRTAAAVISADEPRQPAKVSSGEIFPRRSPSPAALGPAK